MKQCYDKNVKYVQFGRNVYCFAPDLDTPELLGPKVTFSCLLQSPKKLHTGTNNYLEDKPTTRPVPNYKVLLPYLKPGTVGNKWRPQDKERNKICVRRTALET